MSIKKSNFTINVADDFEDIFEVSYDGVVIIDSKATILYCNDLWVDLAGFKSAGYTREDMVGADLRYFINTGIGLKAVALDALDAKKKLVSLSYSLDNRAIVATATPFFKEDGSIKYVVAFVKDESEIYKLKATSENAIEIQSMYIDYLYNGVRKKEKAVVVKDPTIKEIYRNALKVSESNATLLITGESGTGKDVLANFIHDHSRRKNAPFIAINCGAIPENLVESEFFGYEKGAFTGASKEGKVGFFEAANGGTLFLDEIGELPINMQIKLLRVLESRQVTKIGSNEPIEVDVRIIAATNRNLLDCVNAKTFRLDLYYRINVIKFQLPALRDRPKDIEGLIEMYMEHFNREYSFSKTISLNGLNYLKEYEWPGNIRELRNVIENAILMSDGNEIGEEYLNKLLQIENKSLESLPVTVNRIAPLQEILSEAERQLLVMVSKKRHSSRDIAKILKIDQTTASRKLKKYDIEYKIN